MISIKNKKQQDGIRRSAELLSKVFREISPLITPGITTLEIDRVVEKTIRSGGGFPAFLGYQGFPASVCTSVNEQVIHGIPDSRSLKNGDIIGCDIGVELDGYYSDASKTFAVGQISAETSRLMETGVRALEAALEVCRPGKRIKDIGKAVTGCTKAPGYGIVYSYCGHGVGLGVHEEPQIPNYYPSRGFNHRLRPGMVLAVEPMINAGAADVELLDDEWTVVTADRSLSVHFEHTVLVTDSGPEILTSWGD